MESELAELVSASAAADSGAPVPHCPPWTVEVLLGHVGGSHRWATEVVRRLPRSVLRPGPVESPVESGARSRWLAEGGRALVEALRAADPDAPVWTWGGDHRVRWWGSRQLHETAMHRADLCSAVDADWRVDEAVAVDGVEEFLANLPFAELWAPRVAKLRGDGETLLLSGPRQGWLIRLGPKGFDWQRADGEPAAVTVAGSAADLYLFVWGRRSAESLTVTGDRELLDRWCQNSRI